MGLFGINTDFRIDLNLILTLFSVKQNLMDHMRIHNPDAQFKCEFCDKRFSHPSNLKRHTISVHTDDRPFKCDKCNKGFVERRRLEWHLKSNEHLVRYLHLFGFFLF